MPHNSILTALLCSTLAVAAAAQSSDTSSSSQDQQNSTNPPIQNNSDQQRPTDQQPGSQLNVTPMQNTPTYRVNVTSRTTNAVDYRHRAGSTKVEMKGTDISPQITGDAKVDSKAGRLEVNTSLEHMKPATTFGPQYLTYVLWAITPAGRPMNLGEILPNDDGKVDLHSTTDLQSFGLIVTAEPYFAVTRPSNMVVAENIIHYGTKGWEQPITAQYEALNRNEYTVDINAAQLPATSADKKKVPLELLEARNAVAIAKAEGADQYAPDVFQKAQDFLAKGEDYLNRKQGKSAIGTVARYAAQQAEDARVIAIRKKAEETAAAERQKLQDQEAAARQQAQENADRAQREAEQRQQAEQTAEQQRLAAEQAQQAAQQAAQERAAAEQARQQAIAEQQRLQQQQQQLQQQVQQAQNAAQQAEMEREQTRQRLTQQLNQVLQTQDTARGLIVNMSDVLFDFNKATLKPGARERLAKVAGIILAYPDLKLQVEGYTDNIGSDQYNMQLSQKRAQAVQQYLESEGVNSGNVTARGFGKSAPVASNATAAGRQQNRRVELVVNGEAINAQGRVPGSPAASPGTTAVGSQGGNSTVERRSYSETNTTTTQPAGNSNAAQPQPMNPPTNPTDRMSQPAGQATQPSGSMSTPNSTPASQTPNQSMPGSNPANTPAGTTNPPPPNTTTPPPTSPQ